MDDSTTLPIIFFIAATIQVYISIKALTNKAYISNYVKKSHKAWVWRKMFGEEKTIILIKRVFAPLGIIMAIGYVILGILFFFKYI